MLVTGGVNDVLREPDGSPSRDRLSRIAAMIRDAEQAGDRRSGPQRRVQRGRPIPLATRRRARQHAGR